MREEASLAMKWPVYGPPLHQSLDLDVIPWALVAAERVLGVRGDSVRAGVGCCWLQRSSWETDFVPCLHNQSLLDPFTSFRLKTPVLCRMWVSRGPVVGLRQPSWRVASMMLTYMGLGSGLAFFKPVQRQLARSRCCVQGLT